MAKKNAFLALASLSLAGWACNGFPNLTNPQEVAEFIPSDVTLDVSEMPDDITAKISNADLPNGEAERRGNAMKTCGGVVHGFHHAAAVGLAIGAAIRADMTDPSNVHVAGTVHVHGDVVKYLADFSAFDFDGDGTADGSGNANDEPVALRMWVDHGDGYVPFLCALVTTKPTSDNIGAGAAYVRPGKGDKDEASDLQIYLAWDRTDTTDKWNEAFVTGELRSHLKFDSSHTRVDVQTLDDGHVEKSVRTSANFAENAFNFATFKSSAHFSEGSKAALFSVEATGDNATISFDNICVDFKDAAVDDTACADFDTTQTAFIDLPTGDETVFPTDFPAAPTFNEADADNAGHDNTNDNVDDNGNENENENDNENSNGN